MPTFEEFKSQGNSAFSAKEYKRAAKIYRDAIAQYGDNPVIYSNRAQCFLHLKDWTRAYRDANSGLECGPADKIKVKLLFRKGTAARELGLDLEAVQCFQDLLSIDPTNTGAQAEIEKLNTVPKLKKLRADGRKIPIECVDTLPTEFANIVSPPVLAEKVQPKVPTNSSLVDDVAEELFGKKETKAPPKISEISEPASKDFGLLPSMHFLSALKQVPLEKKAHSYRYATNLEDLVLTSLFKKLGVDQDFFDFFVEASTFVISNDKDPATTTRNILRQLQLMSTFNRFSLTLTMCDEKLLKNLISVVSRVSPDNLNQLEHIFQSR